jgi:hypothetical protein
LDVELPVAPLPIADPVPPPLVNLSVDSVDEAANRRTLIALGASTFVAALVLVIPPAVLPADGQ